MLDYISKQPNTPLVECEDNITNTDWQESNNTTRKQIKVVAVIT